MTDCLAVPTSQVTKPPTPPDPVTDEWVRAAWLWMSNAVGLITVDREEWQGERDCVRRKAKEGAIR